MTDTQSGDETEGLQRITVNLIPKAQNALRDATAAERLSKTDVVNRALMMYAFIVTATSRGEEVYLGKPGEELSRIRWL